MNYTYFIEENANKHFSMNELNNTLNILCYHINTDSKYPFLQFMLEKIPFCHDIVKEQLILPYIREVSSEIQILDKIKLYLQNLGCNTDVLDESAYKGIIFGENKLAYALVNISCVDINYMKIFRDSCAWFVLSNDIVNTKQICNIPIDDSLVELFTSVPELGVLFNSTTLKPYILPESVYSGGEYKEVEFNGIFGQTKQKVYNCDNYFYFYSTFGNAVKDGGWNNSNASHNKSGRLCVENNNQYFKYIHGGINRYALFTDDTRLYMQEDPYVTLTQEILETVYTESCIFITQSNNNPDILVKEHSIFFPLSYYGLNKRILGEYYKIDDEDNYMIS